MIRRIGHVTTDYRPAVGGAEIYVAALKRELASIAEEQIVFQLDNRDHDPELESDPAIVLIPRLPGPYKWRRGPNLYWFNHGLKRAAIRAKLKECDLLIVHYPFHWPAVRWHPRVIAVSHCVEWCQPPKRFTHRRRKSIAKRCVKDAAGIVANDTNFWREMGIRVQPKEKLWEEVAPRRWCLPNAVDTKQFSPKVEARMPDRLNLYLSRGFGAPRPFILVARNAMPHRGIHLAIEGLGRIAADHPDMALVVAGSHPSKSYRAQCDQVTASFGIKDRVAYMGHVPPEEMPGLYRCAALTLVPTIRHEGTSLAALEAMACGTPTISSNHGGLADLPTVQVPADGKKLAKAIEEVWIRREEIGKRQRKVVKEKFAIDRWGEAWRGVVEKVMGAK